MNYRIIVYTTSQILKILALLFLVPIITAICYGEKEGFAYVISAVICLVTGFILSIFVKVKNQTFFLREGCVITVVSWLCLSFFGALPFMFTGEMNNSFVDAIFESVSGFTTTGSTILTDVEVLSHCTLMWRSFSHWIGGLGVLVFLLSLLPNSSGYNVNIMRAESSGQSVDKLAPKITETARILYVIYIILTLAQVLFLLFGNISLFESLNIAFSTTGTGGFGIKNDSLAGYSDYIQWVTTIFMFLAAMKFTFYYYIVFRGPKKAFSSDEVRGYILIFFASIAICFTDVFIHMGNALNSIKDTSFMVASIMSTTGFAIADYQVWPGVSKTVILILIFFGGCTGSTAGGFKISRVVILFKVFRSEIYAFIHPKSVKRLTMEGAILENSVIRGTTAYLAVYLTIFVVSSLLVAISCSSLTTGITSVAATLNNVGPGFGDVGPTGNFFFHTVLSKIVMIFDMLAGRLELFPIIAIFARRH